MEKDKIILMIKIQSVVFLYSIISILSKIASSYLKESLLTVALILLIMLFTLAIYAVFWQKLLKKIDLSVAYVNKGMLLFWSMLWSIFLFKEHITLYNLLGTAIIFIGILVVNDNV